MLQIQKQFFGQAIMMYVLGYYARYGKMTTKLYILEAISVFTHAANLLFIPFLLIKKLRGNLSKQALMFMSMMFVTLIILGPRIAGSLSVENGGVLSYGVSRLADSDGLADNAGSLTFLHPRTLIILLPLLYVLYKKLWRERKALTSMFTTTLLSWRTRTNTPSTPSKMPPVMGKASFIDIHDRTGRIQVYLRINDLGEEVYRGLDKWDIGDIASVKGFVFRTRRGEISIHAKEVRLLSKSLLPLPDQFHGLTNTDLRYRQRYVDLIVNPDNIKESLYSGGSVNTG